jgi:hypothetical protein
MVTITMPELRELLRENKIFPHQVFDAEELLEDENVKSYIEQKKEEYKKKKDESADFIPGFDDDEPDEGSGSEESPETSFIPD